MAAGARSYTLGLGRATKWARAGSPVGRRSRIVAWGRMQGDGDDDGAPARGPEPVRGDAKGKPAAAVAIADLPPAGALIGLDVGTKTIGVAVSDATRLIATPIEVVHRSKFRWDAERLMHLAAERRVVAFVVGLPLNMDGSEGPRAQSSRAFAQNLTRAANLPCAFWDERLSTVAVTRALIEADASRARRARVVDMMAAAYILQGVLDSLRRRG